MGKILTMSNAVHVFRHFNIRLSNIIRIIWVFPKITLKILQWIQYAEARSLTFSIITHISPAAFLHWLPTSPVQNLEFFTPHIIP